MPDEYAPDEHPPSPQRVRWMVPLAIVGLALILRLITATVWDAKTAESRFYFGDSDSYWVLAETIAHGDEYRYGEQRVFRTPGYPLFLAGLMSVWPGELPILAARFSGAILGTLSVFLVIISGTRFIGERAGWLAGGLAAIWPEALLSDVLILSECLFVPLMLGQLFCMTEIAVRSAAQRNEQKVSRLVVLAVLAGVLSGCAILVRPSGIFFLPFAGMLIVCFSGRRVRWMGLLVMMGLAQTVVMSPWLIRNATLTGKVIPTTLTTGASLYDGLRPTADGGSDMRFIPEFRHQLTLQTELPEASEDRTKSQQIAFEIALDRTMRDAALDWATAHPGDALRLARIKFLRLWNPFPNHDGFSSPAIRIVTALTYGPILLLALIGTGVFLRRRAGVLIFATPAIYFTLLHLIFVSSIRYREPPMMALIVLAGGVLLLSDSIARSRKKTSRHTVTLKI